MKSLGHEIQYSELPHRDDIARQFIQLGDESHKIARFLAELDKHVKHVMDTIVSLYEEFEIKLDGSRNGTYTVGDVADSHRDLLKIVDGLLGDLQKQVRKVLREIEEALVISDHLEANLMRSQNEVTDKWDLFRISRPLFLWAIPWTTASKIKEEKLVADRKLCSHSLKALSDVRRSLLALDISIVSFQASVVQARAANNREHYVELTEEHFRKSLRLRLGESRTRIDGWQK